MMFQRDHSGRRRRDPAAVAGLILLSALTGCSCGRGGNGSGELPAKNSPDYARAVRAFYVGAAALQVGDRDRAKNELEAASRLAPGEPAIWADLGLLAIISSQLDLAAKHIDRALAIAPDDTRILVLKGLLDGRQGRFDDGIAHLRQALERSPGNLKAQYALVEMIDRKGGPESDAQKKALLTEILKESPDNLFAITELARLAAKSGDPALLKDLLSRMEPLSRRWPAEPRRQLAALQSSVTGGNLRMAATGAIILQNVLRPTPAFQISYLALKTPDKQVAEPLLRMVKLPNPPSAPAAPDTALMFATGAAVPGSEGASAARAVYLTQETNPVVISASAMEVAVAGASGRLAFPGAGGTAPSQSAICAADLNNDFRTDLALAGAGGLKLYRQGANGAFKDVTAEAKLAPMPPLYGVWAADLDLDGDLDLVAAPLTGPLIVLQNNADGTFTKVPLFGISDVRDFAWADIDEDGDADAIFLDGKGKVRVFLNERSNQFRESALPPDAAGVVAITILDADDDGVLDIVALKSGGDLIRISYSRGTESWTTAVIGHWDGAPAGLAAKSTRLLACDLDNNGGIDIIASTPTVSKAWLKDSTGRFTPLAAAIPGRIQSVDDMTGTGKMDLVGITPSGAAVYANHGSRAYGWYKLRQYAAFRTRNNNPNRVLPDERINAFGICGSIEIRAGLLVQEQLISEPVVHFGLGENPGIDVARITWPNGVTQGEFGLKPNTVLAAVQRLDSSCPWLFAWDGKRMAFVTDVLWRSPLGLKINAQDTGAVAMTEDWVRIRGGQLAPRDGYYDLRITAELWETHFFDQVTLMAVDHPAGSEVFVDERFAIPPPRLALNATGPLHAFQHVADQAGADVSDTVRELDGRYLGTFALSKYRGIAEDHYVELALGDDAPASGPLWLVAQGWVNPTDSSLNVAMSQGKHEAPRSLALEVPDGKGGWIAVRKNLGFPAGKTKTVLIDLEGVFRPGAPRRLRLRTNLEIYWDRLAWAAGTPGTPLRTQRILPETAVLRDRGYSAYSQPVPTAPEIPDYNSLLGSNPRWRDLIGFCTRFGDVRELLAKVDDRYVIMNAGDEMAFRFPAAQPPPPGWVRDFVFIADGWEKDGNLNTTYSKTVLPLPSHDNPRYNRPPGRLEDDPVYRRHSRDWQTFHTRYVTPDAFAFALRIKDDQ